jgi:hypothetical protein
MGYGLIDLTGQTDVTVLRVWGRGDPASVTYQRVALGTCADGWWVQRSGRSGTKTWHAWHERAACTTIERWIRAGGWTEITDASCVSPS